MTCEDCGNTFEKIADVYDHALRTHKKGPMDKEGIVSQGNPFLNVGLMTNFKIVLSELEALNWNF